MAALIVGDGPAAIGELIQFIGEIEFRPGETVHQDKGSAGIRSGLIVGCLNALIGQKMCCTHNGQSLPASVLRRNNLKNSDRCASIFLMDDRFRLVFRGEVLEGQHPAVVRRRIAEALKLSDEKIETLFSGKVVVLKRDADEQTASRYQALFQKAGARLRLLPVASAAEDATEDPGEDAALPVSASSGSGLSVAADYVAPPSAPAAAIEAPDFAVAEPGSLLGEPRPGVAANVPDVNFDLAERGADLGSKKRVQPAVDLADIHFEVAEVGADLGELRRTVEAVEPDISHLKLADA